MIKTWASYFNICIGTLITATATLATASVEFHCEPKSELHSAFNIAWDEEQEEHLYYSESGEFGEAKLVADRMGPFGTIRVFSIFDIVTSERFLDIEIRQNQKSFGITANDPKYFRAIVNYGNRFESHDCERLDW